jgi:hypothetical protein
MAVPFCAAATSPSSAVTLTNTSGSGALEAAVRRVSIPMIFVVLQVAEKVLETEVADMRCLDLNFVPLTSLPEKYFAELEVVYDDLLRQIECC